ncbi:MAG TPA: LLM class flavin-dependent oxidoreductase [Acidimicrobiales bacterium]|jgi:alkanesulfonate monooxygenase SsuD/methylene tetrahydromethanopterin reductase-like flavin-dependent oxidoreductase (luciferase family)|nr:LLM class flavin-dependent oxidoreductase [Acidimicrobiales bacterium]
MHVGLVVLPSDRWREARRQWEWADDVGFATAWTYDHIRWSGMADGPWHAAIPVLAAAAGVTTRIRLGTLVATPNFRHPVTLARDVISLDDLSAGRFDLGVGPGSEGPDATALGQAPWSAAERMDRFAEFLHILRPMLDGDASTRTNVRGRYYSATDAPSTPGTWQTPFPLTVAAGGRRGLALAAAYGAAWVTIGPGGREPRTAATVLAAVRRQGELLELACRQQERDITTLRKVILWTPAEPVITSMDQFEALAAPYAELGFDQLVLHHPAQTGPYGGSVSVFEQIAARYGAAGS